MIQHFHGLYHSFSASMGLSLPNSVFYDNSALAFRVILSNPKGLKENTA